MADELTRPLRRRRLADHLQRLRPSPLVAASLVVATAAIGLAVWLLTSSDAYDVGPVVRVSIAPPDPISTSSVGPPSGRASGRAGGRASDRGETPERLDSELALPPPNDVAADHVLAGQTVAAVAPRERPLAPAPVSAVSEAGPFGVLPRIASDGRKPFEVYARAVPSSVLSSETPKIAIVLGGMGLNGELTRQAIRDLPAAVTLAFAPYGDSVQKLADEARARGHEVMLHLPMEPFGFPALDPGPKTLRAGDDASGNPDNLAWLMSRFAGYAGVVNYMGARLSADESALRPVLAEIARRGLVYLDDGSSARSLAPRLGQELRLPVRRAQMIDAGPAFNDIRASLALLEEEARRSGLAIGTGTGLPVTIDAVRSWARDLASRGVILVPLSATFHNAP